MAEIEVNESAASNLPVHSALVRAASSVVATVSASAWDWWGFVPEPGFGSSSLCDQKENQGNETSHYYDGY
jgi:hypothetical protein